MSAFGIGHSLFCKFDSGYAALCDLRLMSAFGIGHSLFCKFDSGYAALCDLRFVTCM